MNAETNTQNPPEPQSLRKQIDELATTLEARLSQIASLLDVALDTYPSAVTPKDRRDIENASNMICVGLDRARDALCLAGRIEVLARHIPDEVAA